MQHYLQVKNTKGRKLQSTVDPINYRVITASIQDGSVYLTFQLIAGNLVRKNHPTQVIGFIVDLAGKCVEGM
jgi:hypothetical protein